MEEKHHTTGINTPQFVSSDSTAFPKEYASWLKDIKMRYRQAQCKAALKVNAELLQFYWQLGRDIVAMHIEDQWGKGVMKQLSLDMREAFPNQAGFSHTNLKYIKRWYSFYSQTDIIGQQPVDQLEFPSLFAMIPWEHHIYIITHCNSTNEALFYIDRTIEGNWSRRMLENNIEADLYGRQSKAITNFDKHLPAVQSKLAEELLKDIVENEQHNNQRAAYGKKVLQQLSNKLTDRFGKGWSVETLTKCRKFYCAYSISSDGQTKSQPNEKSSAPPPHFINTK